MSLQEEGGHIFMTVEDILLVSETVKLYNNGTLPNTVDKFHNTNVDKFQ